MGVAGTDAGGDASDVYESSGDLYAVSGGDHDICGSLHNSADLVPVSERHKPDVKNPLFDQEKAALPKLSVDRIVWRCILYRGKYADRDEPACVCGSILSAGVGCIYSAAFACRS